MNCISTFSFKRVTPGILIFLFYMCKIYINNSFLFYTYYNLEYYTDLFKSRSWINTVYCIHVGI